MKLIALTSSVGTTSTVRNSGYIDMLQKEYNLIGMWTHGFTVVNAVNCIHDYMQRDCHTLLLHLGEVEAFSSKAPYFLHCTMHEMILYRLHNDPNFMAYVAPMMLKATEELDYQQPEKFYRRVEPFAFRHLFRMLANFVPDFKVVVLGMVYPSGPPVYMEQAIEYDTIIQEVCTEYKNLEYVPLFQLTEGQTIDVTHLTVTGHELVYNAIKTALGEG